MIKKKKFQQHTSAMSQEIKLPPSLPVLRGLEFSLAVVDEDVVEALVGWDELLGAIGSTTKPGS